ncbi:serine/threonine-protein kinase VRK1-like [Lineus longissimus]|uniref:serine/threonine-protein kinase VRK1-like n=1 Tax=Lineus longissimus TaxID=88925 RepID=UPI002B4C8DDC
MMPRAAAGRGRGGGRKPKAAAAAGYQHSGALTEGTILTDVLKKEWRIHQPVGQGGFGVLYLASKKDSNSKEPEFVVKMEPKGNGPLFCECTFYQRAAKPEHIQQWLSSTKKKTVGMPKFIALGFQELNNVENRFMVMERFGTDLQKLFVENGKRFPRKAVQQVALRVIDVLEYIHSKDYSHADIKAANLLLGYKNPNQVFLVDFGLAARYRQSNGTHNVYKEDPRKAHDGTIEFTSRDAHRGVAASRRSDLEILGYCLIQWLCGRLPWEDNLANKNYVRDQKLKYMEDIPALMKKCFKCADYPKEIETYLQYVANLEYEETPDYKKMCQIFVTAMKAQGDKDDKLNFTSAGLGRITSPKRQTNKRASGVDSECPTPAKRASSARAVAAESQCPTPAKHASTARARAVAAESQCPTPAKRASTARATPRKGNALSVEPVVSPLSPQLGTPHSSLRGKRKSDNPPAEAAGSSKQRKRPSATKAKAPVSPSSDEDFEMFSPKKTKYDFTMTCAKSNTTMRKVRRTKSVSTKGTQTTPGLKERNPRKKKTSSFLE